MNKLTKMETITFSIHDQINVAPVVPVRPLAMLPMADTSTMEDLNMIQKHERD